MTRADEKPDVIEEVRVVVCDAGLSAAIVRAFWTEGIAAYADYREDEDKSNHDLQLRVYQRDEREAKTMTVGAAIQMVLQRRRISDR